VGTLGVRTAEGCYRLAGESNCAHNGESLLGAHNNGSPEPFVFGGGARIMNMRNRLPAVDGGLMRRIVIDSPVILGFALACVAVFLADNLVAGTAIGLFACPAWAQFWIWHPLNYLRLFTHVLGHANQAHLRGNLTNMLLVGPPCERQFGSRALLAIIGHVALWSALTHLAVGGSTAWQLGASGVVFALILLNSLISARTGELPLTFILTLVLWCSGEVAASLAEDGVSHVAHLSGAAVGSCAGYYLHAAQEKRDARMRGLPGLWRRFRGVE